MLGEKVFNIADYRLARNEDRGSETGVRTIQQYNSKDRNSFRFAFLDLKILHDSICTIVGVENSSLFSLIGI